MAPSGGRVETKLAFKGTDRETHLAIAQGGSRIEINLTRAGVGMNTPSSVSLNRNEPGLRYGANTASSRRKSNRNHLTSSGVGEHTWFCLEMEVESERPSLRWHKERTNNNTKWKSNRETRVEMKRNTWLVIAQGGTRLERKLAFDDTLRKMHLALDSSKQKSNQEGSGFRNTQREKWHPKAQVK
ncbi:hypothetical protein B0H13DRAFT_1865641 [Mycena leptocephala]|nr:hypothetical protein B0H13DRAFT_1865641 [Mycena leptocephala]